MSKISLIKLYVILMSSLYMGNIFAKTKDVTIIEKKISCKATWVCLDDNEPKGEVTSAKFFKPGEEQLCRDHLLEQITETGFCDEDDYGFVEDSFSTEETSTERLVLTKSGGHGSDLIKDFDALHYQMGWSCEGDSCYDVWQRQADQMDVIIKWWLKIKENNWLVSRKIADLAYMTSQYMCRHSSRTGDENWMDFMMKKTNAAGIAFGRIMELGGRQPYYCKLIWR